MALWSLPIKFASPDFNFQVELDGVVFGLRFVLNERSGRYSVSIFTEAGDPIVIGVMLTTNWKPFSRFKDPRLPKGRFFTMDVTGGTSEPDEVNIGDTVLLCYDEATA